MSDNPQCSMPRSDQKADFGESRAHRVVAEFRAAVTGYSDDPDIRRLVDELRIGSSDFERCWQTQGVLAREGGERAFQSSDHGTAALSAGVAVASGLARLSTDDASLCTSHTRSMTCIDAPRCDLRELFGGDAAADSCFCAAIIPQLRMPMRPRLGVRAWGNFMTDNVNWKERRNQIARYRAMEQGTTDPLAARLLHDIVLDLEAELEELRQSIGLDAAA
ncbi:MmyB family transcriptional regulator [Bradyrhizobium sp.]|uniref:MmyB family transcriptional regulator n=1 Tax=Bradyrhizobium sp. TaxID=376 RepID=UPI002B50CFD1|nr:hypothetical protein [Bradyrhizobium sp.]HMM89819.1 hypothetical protein [Bradyrhizobium sp.]